MRSLKVYVTPQFVQEFLDLFDSEESVERDYLKNILHKLYAKVGFATWTLNVGLPRVFYHDVSLLNYLFLVGPQKEDDQKSN